MARISENQIADLLEEECNSECGIDSDKDVNNLVVSTDSENDQEECSFVSSNQPYITSPETLPHYLGKDKTTIWNKYLPP
jgi:hypothetical protein